MVQLHAGHAPKFRGAANFPSMESRAALAAANPFPSLCRAHRQDDGAANRANGSQQTFFQFPIALVLSLVPHAWALRGVCP